MKRIFAAGFLLLLLAGCDTIDLYEQTVPLTGQAWKSSTKPSFRFTIKDTASPYQVFITLRHTARYHFNNIWVRLKVDSPEGKPFSSDIELPLANPATGWLGSGMDDVYEHRILLPQLTPDDRFHRAGTYTFTLEHLMREDPLEQVLNVGLRVEKKQR